jgi:integrase
MRRVELPGVPEADQNRYLDAAEWEAVLRRVVPDAYERLDRAFYLTAIMAGLRHGELIALRWRDVDWVAGRVRVRQNYVLGEYDTPKSRRGSRSVPMTDRLAGELDRLFQAHEEPGPVALVFPDPITGGPLDNAANLSAIAGCSRPRLWMPRTTCTGCGIPSAREWPQPASRCAPCRSGWGTGTSPRRSGTPTMRPASTRPS